MKILATLDGSRESKAIIPVLVEMARDSKVEVTLLTVAEPVAGVPRGAPVTVTPGGQLGPAAVATMRSEAILQPPERKWVESKEQALARVHAEALDNLEDFAAPLKRAGVHVKGEVVTNERPAEAIIGFARDHGFDLIAMATHGRSGLRELVQGSVAAAVVRSGVAPVLLVRPKA